MKAVARDRRRPRQRVRPALLMLIGSAAVFSMVSKDGIAADDKHESTDPRLVVSVPDSVKPGAIDPHDAEWINALAEPRKRRRHSDVDDGRGNVAFLNDDGEVVGLCTAGPSSATSSINDAFLHEFLTRFTKVNRLYLRDTPKVSDEGLDALANQTGLRKLTLASPKVTDAGIARLTKLNQLESLFIYSDKVTDKSVESISQLIALKQLTLNGTQVTRDGVLRLKNALPNCTINVSSK